MTFDFIIVGGGTAGCVLANRLSSDPNVKVLLVECGRDARPLESVVPAAWTKLLTSRHDWAYRTAPEPGLDGRSLLVPRGRILGGSSTINTMMYVRGNRADFDEWASLGATDWTYADVARIFDRIEGRVASAGRIVRTGGMLPVQELPEPNPMTRAFVQAAVQTGIAPNSDYNGATQDGVGITQTNIVDGRRVSPADVYLRPVLNRPNLKVLTQATVGRILFEGRRAVAVESMLGGRRRIDRAEREIVLAAGSIGSPQILQLSGIGDGARLRSLGIEIVASLAGVGENLQDHPAGVTIGTTSRPESLKNAESIASVLSYVFRRRGMLTSNGGEAVAFVRTSDALEVPDVELLFLPVTFRGEGLVAPIEHGYTIASMLLKPRSRGRVSLASSNPFDAPRIEAGHFSDPEGADLRTVSRGMQLTREIVHRPAFAKYRDGSLAPFDADGRTTPSAIRAGAQAVYHPVGTCKIGRDARSVVGPDLRVHGVERLRIADASVMPTITRGHTMAPTLMIAERAADWMLAGI